ncbi:MAG TPA: hypothetical protein DCG60_03475 [Tissierella sp.]|uniref:hypothetical protein n=1 Tax=Tissierella praeacuta TaxID=43131 RepID=UPI000EBDB342|nr:hypothetical protein [Tissierella praeacuta]HAE91692.1 hypothetical protein [Tissierella sp.]
MKKLIGLIGCSLILTSCSGTVNTEDNFNNRVRIVKAHSLRDNQEQVYVEEYIKNVIDEINHLGEKYKDVLKNDNFDLLYINIYDNYPRDSYNTRFDNNMSRYHEDYFNDLIQIIDKSIAHGLKAYVKEMSNKKLEPNTLLSKKIGRAIVTVSTADNINYKDNRIAVELNILDIKDNDYRNIFNKISDDNYILDNVIKGEELDLINFVNSSGYIGNYRTENPSIRYNLFLKNKEIEKVNILIKKDKDSELDVIDIEVYLNLLSSLNLNKEERILLLEEYRDIFEEKVNSKKISTEKYNIIIEGNKGNKYLGESKQFIYFSIEKK